MEDRFIGALLISERLSGKVPLPTSTDIFRHRLISRQGARTFNKMCDFGSRTADFWPEDGQIAFWGPMSMGPRRSSMWPGFSGNSNVARTPSSGQMFSSHGGLRVRTASFSVC
jgi:hypothetical protein